MRLLIQPVAQIRRVVPQRTEAHAHARRDKVPQIPLSEQNSRPVKIAAVDAGTRRRRFAGHIDTLKVGAYENRPRCRR